MKNIPSVNEASIRKEAKQKGWNTCIPSLFNLVNDHPTSSFARSAADAASAAYPSAPISSAKF